MTLALFLLLLNLPHFLHLILTLSAWPDLPHISRISTAILLFLTLPFLFFHSPMFLDMLNSLHLIVLSSMPFLLMLSPFPFHKLLLFPSGTKQCKMNFRLLNRMKLGLSLFSHLVNILWAANGYISSNSELMALLSNIEQVTKCYTQQKAVDYLDTFFLVAKLVIIKIFLALVALNGWFIVQLDVNNVIFHGDLTKEVYMCLPLRYHCEGEQLTYNIVCQWHKSIYGLKQASRQWFAQFSSVLLEEGFTQSTTDHSLFIKQEGNSFLTLLVCWWHCHH